MKPQDKVTVINSDHSMVNPGDSGVIDCVHAGGFGVAITKVWPLPQGAGERKEERRVIWFPRTGGLKLAAVSK